MAIHPSPSSSVLTGLVTCLPSFPPSRSQSKIPLLSYCLYLLCYFYNEIPTSPPQQHPPRLLNREMQQMATEVSDFRSASVWTWASYWIALTWFPHLYHRHFNSSFSGLGEKYPIHVCEVPGTQVVPNKWNQLLCCCYFNYFYFNLLVIPIPGLPCTLPSLSEASGQRSITPNAISFGQSHLVAEESYSSCHPLDPWVTLFTEMQLQVNQDWKMFT